MGRSYTAEAWDLGTVFDGKTEYTIPDYQRSYAWNLERVEDLWEDLMGGYLDNPDSMRGEYVLGPLVLAKQKRNAYEVVDGQQRLVTLALMLCALRDSLRTHCSSANDTSDLDNAMREIDDSVNRGREMIRLNNCSDRTVFDGIRNSADARERSNAIYRNYAKLRTFTDELCNRCGIGDPESHRSGMHRFHRILTDLRRKISFVCVNIDDEDHSRQYQIFESLNSKGQSLRQADLIKNYVLNTVDPKMRKEAGDRWNDITRKFVLTAKASGRKMTPDDIIYDSMFSRLTKSHEDVRKRTLYKAVKTRYRTSDIIEYLGQLEEDVGFIKAITNPGHSSDMPPKLRHACHGLRQLRAVSFKRPIIAACRKWGLWDPRTADLADCLVKFFFVYRTVCKKDIDPLKRNARRMTGQIIDGEGLDRVLWTLLKYETPSGERDYVNMSELENMFDEAVFDLGDAEAKYVLVSLEHALQSQRDALINGADFELERIFPNKSGTGHWPGSDELIPHSNRLGNVTLIEKGWHSILRRHGFGYKKDGVETSKKRINPVGGLVGYSQSGLELNRRYLAETDQWTVAEIAERERRLKQLAADAWNLSGYAGMAKAPL